MSNARTTRGIDQQGLKQIICYDAKTGRFTWLANRGGKAKAGSLAGGVNKRGYVEISIGCKKWLAHRLAWFYVHGEMPDTIDHVNGDGSDNRLANIRNGTQSLNLGNTKRRINNTSGYKGVSFCADTKRWAAQIRKDGRKWTIGRYDTPELAHAAYCARARELFGDFMKDGR